MKTLRSTFPGTATALLLALWWCALSTAVGVLPNMGLLDDDADDPDQDDDRGEQCDPPSANDGPAEGGEEECGMPVWRVSEPYINLWLHDTPVQYRLPNGKWMKLRLSYKQRGNLRSTNVAGFGPNWGCNWLGYLCTPANSSYPSNNFRAGGSIFIMQGGGVVYTEAGTGRRYMPGSKYLESPAGSKNSYGFPFGGDAGSTLDLLSERIDQYGRATVHYYWTNAEVGPRQYARLLHVTDRDGRTNYLGYDNTNFPALITSVTNPFGRTAFFNYNTNGWLTNIKDMAGMPSSFEYDANGVITNLITPYGSTKFRSITDGNDRVLEITEANNQKQLYVYRHDGATGYESARGYYASTDAETAKRNSYHWDRKQYAAISEDGKANYSMLELQDYWKASLKHWLLRSDGKVSDAAGAMAGPAIHPDISSNRCNQVSIEYKDQSGNTIPDYQAVQRIVWNGTEYATGVSPAVEIQRNDWLRPTSVKYWFNGSAATYTHVYDTDGRVLQSITGPRGETVRSYGYHTNNAKLLVGVTNAVGQYLVFSHEWPSYWLHSVTNSAGSVTEFDYYRTGLSNGYVKSVTQLGVRTNSFVYQNGNVRYHTNEMGRVTAHSWDDLSRLTQVLYPDTTHEDLLYNKLDLIRFTDRLNAATHFVYDEVRQLRFVTNALGTVTEYDYCGCGSPEEIRVRGAGQLLTYHFDYDLAGRLTNAAYADGYSNSLAYDALSRISEVVGSGNFIRQFSYNDYHQVTQLVAGVGANLGTLSLNAFDEYGRLTNHINRNGVPFTFRYDNAGRLLERATGTARAEKFYYSLQGLTNYVDALGSNTWFGYHLGQLRFQTNADGGWLQFSNWPSGQIRMVTDENGHTTTWNRDEYGLVTNKVDTAQAEVFHFTYYPGGRLMTLQQPGGILSTFSYDDLGNLTLVNHPGSILDVRFDYDQLGRLTNMVDALPGPTKFTWKNDGQIESEDGPWTADTVQASYLNRVRNGLSIGAAWSQNYGLDSYGRLGTITSQAGGFTNLYKSISVGNIAMLSSLRERLNLPSGSSIQSAFDHVARLTNSALKNPASVVLDLHTNAYNDAHQIIRQARKDNNYWDYTYDGNGQLLTAKGKEAGGATRLHEQFGYAHDKAGNLTWRTNNNLKVQFQPNALNQLQSASRSGTLTVAGVFSDATTPVFLTVTNMSVANSGGAATVYADGSWARTNFSPVNGANTFVAWGTDGAGKAGKTTNIVTLPLSVSFAYDARGNLTNDGPRTFQYDYDNQLTNVFVTGQWRCAFVYDGLGRLRIKREYSETDTLTNEVRYLYDGMLPVQERDGANNVTVTYTRGPDLSGSLQGAGGIGGLLARSQGSSHAFYYNDPAGNITSMIDPAGAVVARYAYDPFGNLLGMSGPLAAANRYRFSSKEYLPNPGLYYYGFRFYDPNLQRWLNRDPLGEAGGLDLYGFVDNNPLSFVDPFGLEDKSYGRQLGEKFCKWVYDKAMATPEGSGYNPDSNAAQWGSQIAGSEWGTLGEAVTEGGGLAGDAIEEGVKGSVAGKAAGVVGAGCGPLAKLLKKLFGKSDEAAALAAKTLPPLRQAYEAEVRALADLGLASRGAGANAEATARLLHAERDALKLKYRAMSPPDKVLEWQARSMERWGNPLGPTIDQLRAKGKTWEQIIESAARPGGGDLDF